MVLLFRIYFSRGAGEFIDEAAAVKRASRASGQSGIKRRAKSRRQSYAIEFIA
jgi:hypothetical protein